MVRRANMQDGRDGMVTHLVGTENSEIVETREYKSFRFYSE